MRVVQKPVCGCVRLCVHVCLFVWVCERLEGNHEHLDHEPLTCLITRPHFLLQKQKQLRDVTTLSSPWTAAAANESSTSRQRTLNHRSTDLTKSHSSTHMFEKTGQIHNISKKEMKGKEKLSNRKHWCSRFKIQGKQTKPKPNHSRFSRCQNQTF